MNFINKSGIVKGVEFMGFSEKFGVESIDGKALCSCANCGEGCFWFRLIQILIRRNNIMMQDDCNGLSNKVSLLIKEINSYDSQNNFPSKNKKIKIIIGDDVYPSKFIQNTSTANIPFYKNNGFNHVAFLTKEAMVRRAHIEFDNVLKYIDGNPINVCNL